MLPVPFLCMPKGDAAKYFILQHPSSSTPHWEDRLLLALLIGNRAGSLAGRLAGSLAFAAAAFNSGLFQILLVDGLNVFHKSQILQF